MFGDERLPSRFWSKVTVDPATGCWLWVASRAPNGYGKVQAGSRRDGTRRIRSSHRFAYESLVGPVPDGMQLDHRCRVRACCNPDHMEPVTSRENTMRGLLPSNMRRRGGAQNRSKTHCKNGHEYTEANTYRHKGSRYCRACNNAQSVRRRGHQ